MTEHQASSLCVALSGVGHRFAGNGRDALDNVNLTMDAGETVALIGPSGAGKSTLLALIDGRLRGWTGGALVMGKALSPARPPARSERTAVGFVFQEFALIERVSALRNVLNGRLGHQSVVQSLFGTVDARDEHIAMTALRDVGLEDMADRRVDRLSGGQRQRVAIARCLAQEPSLILADEPVSSLDPRHARETLDLLAKTARSRGATLVFSSHQPDVAAEVADRIIAMRDGKIVLDRATGAIDAAEIADLYSDQDRQVHPLRLVG